MGVTPEGPFEARQPEMKVQDATNKLVNRYGLDDKDRLVLHTLMHQLRFGGRGPGYSVEDLHDRFAQLFHNVHRNTIATLGQPRHTDN